MSEPRSQLLRLRGWSYRQLREEMTRSEIDCAIAAGSLERIRKGFYLTATTPAIVRSAAHLHARLDCVSLLALLGIFVLERHGLHVQFEHGTTATPPSGPDVVRHWRSTSLAPHALVTDIVGALAQACRCQSDLAVVATLDSAWHKHFVDAADMADVFALLPQTLQPLRADLEPRSESGSETIIRVALRRRGWRVEVQVRIDGVGRVDLLIEGWLIVECDSEAHHSDWAQQREDRRRDQAAAARG